MNHGLALALLVVLVVLVEAMPVGAHNKGIYNTQAEAEQRARELGCRGTHQNNGLWMPCSDERHLHRELREQ